MLFLLFNLIICSWKTTHVGTPIKNMVKNDFVYIYSKEGVLSCFEISTGFYFWRTFIDGVMGYDIEENLIVAANSRYFYKMDNESGVILSMYKHQVKDVQSVAFDVRMYLYREKEWLVYITLPRSFGRKRWTMI